MDTMPDAMDLVEGLENENRRLRAANAELLVALKELFDDTEYGSPKFKKALAAIAKAEGK